MTDRLNQILRTHRLSRASLARGLGVDRSTITHWLASGRRPEAADQETVQRWLEGQGVPQKEAALWDEPIEPLEVGAAGPASPTASALESEPQSVPPESEDPYMLLRRQPLHQPTRKHFGLSCDPFARDLESHEDVYITPDTRYVTEALWSTALHGGLLAVVGESGSGKTTLLDDLADRISRDSAPLVLIRPDVTGMETSDVRGRVLRVGHIQEAVIRALAPDASLKSSPEARADQMRRLLIAARESGKRVCLAFDEAHAMPIATLKHLKRLLEVKQGFTRLLSIVLLGQPELGTRLSERNPEVREVVQRCEVVTLDPLDDQLAGYLRHKLNAAGRALEDLVTQDGLDALRERLGIASLEARAKGQARPSRAYPLAAGNLLAAALNIAAVSAAPRVTSSTVRMVGA